VPELFSKSETISFRKIFMSVWLSMSLEQAYRIALFCLVLTLSACATHAETEEIVFTGHGGFLVFSLTKQRNAYFPKSAAYDRRLKSVQSIAENARAAAWIGAKARLSVWRDHDWHDYGFDEYVASANFIREIRSNRVTLADKNSNCSAELGMRDAVKNSDIFTAAPQFEEHEQYWRCQENGINDLFFDITEDSILTLTSAQASCGKMSCRKISIFRTPSGIPQIPESREDWLSMANRTDIYFIPETLRLIQTIEHQPHQPQIRRVYDFSSKVEGFSLPRDCGDAIRRRYVLQTSSKASTLSIARESAGAEVPKADASATAETLETNSNVLRINKKDLEAAGLASMQELADLLNDSERDGWRCRYTRQ
jgi:hypothetical protein